MKAFLLSTTYMHELHALLSKTKSDEQLFKTIVDAPFTTHSKGRPIGLTIVVLLLVNKNNNSIDRIALADTESARGAIEFSVKPFHEIAIPLNNKENAVAQAIKTEKHQVVTDWQYLFTPALSIEEARFNQAGAGIATSVVYPLINARDGGALIFSYVLKSDDIAKQYHHFMDHYSKAVAKQLRT